MYAEDSFFTLTVWGQVGLACLSTLLAGLNLALIAKLSAHRPIWMGVGLALVAFWTFIWLSPQVYYTYYLALFDDLPLQSVIGPPPSPSICFQLLLFSERATLSAHSLWALGWLGLILPVWKSFWHRRSAAN